VGIERVRPDLCGGCRTKRLSDAQGLFRLPGYLRRRWRWFVAPT
jgi:hypothetical protein